MIISTQTALPPGATPISIPAGPGARPGDGPATNDAFASLVAQLSGGAPVGRPRAGRAATPAAVPGQSQPFAALSAPGSDAPVPDDGPPASIRATSSDVPSADTTEGAPNDTTAATSDPPADSSTAVPAWLCALADRGTPPVAAATTTACTGSSDAAHLDTDSSAPPAPVSDRFVPASIADRIARDGAAPPGAPFEMSPPVIPAPGTAGPRLPGAAGAASTSASTSEGDAPVAPADLDRFTPASVVDQIARDEATRFGSPIEMPLPVVPAPGQPAPRVDADAPAAAADLDRFTPARIVERIARDRAARPGMPFDVPPPVVPTAGARGEPAAGADSAAPLPAPGATAAAPLPAPAGIVNRIAHDGIPRPAAPADTPLPVVPTPGSAGQPTALAAGVSTTFSLAAGGAVPTPAKAEATDAATARTAPPDRFASARFADWIARDEASRLGAPSPPLAAVSANGMPGEPTPPAARDVVSLAMADLAFASGRSTTSAEFSVSDWAGRDDAQMSSSWSLEAAAAAQFQAEPGASVAARVVEIVGAVGPHTFPPAPTLIPVAPGASLAVADEADLRHQIVQTIKFQWRDGAGDVKVMLHPQYLGALSIALRVDQDGVTAHLSAEAASVRAWASANESLLRQGLAEQGLTLARLIVTEDPSESTPDGESRRRPPQQDTPESPARPRPDAPTFEIVL